jgi:hypothetical protein
MKSIKTRFNYNGRITLISHPQIRLKIRCDSMKTKSVTIKSVKNLTNYNKTGCVLKHTSPNHFKA